DARPIFEPMLAERTLDGRLTRDAEHVRHERIRRERLQVERLRLARERMLLRHERDAVPVVYWQQRELRKKILRARRDREVDLVRADELRDLLGRALVQLEVDARIALAKRSHDLRQDITRLRVRRRDRERAVELGRQVAREALNVADLAQDLARPGDDLAARRRDRGQALALACKQLNAELGLELLQLLADAGLARVEPLGGRRDVEPAVDDADQVFELLQRHLKLRATIRDENAAPSARGSAATRLYNHSLHESVNRARPRSRPCSETPPAAQSTACRPHRHWVRGYAHSQ